MGKKTEWKIAPRIIIVDDHPGQLKILYRILRDAAYAVEIATTGELALQYANDLHPDLILLDVRMPGLNGLNVYSRLKSNSKLSDIPVIFINEIENAVDKPLCYQAGATAYLTKPYNPLEVITCVDANLRLSYMSKRLAELSEEPINIFFRRII